PSCSSSRIHAFLPNPVFPSWSIHLFLSCLKLLLSWGPLMPTTNQVCDWILHDGACVHQAELQHDGRQIMSSESVSLLQLSAATIGAALAMSSAYRRAVYPQR